MKQIISTDKAPAAIGPYSQAVEACGMIYTSGQIPVDPATGVIPEGIEAQAEQVLKNVKNLLEAAGTSLENVVKPRFLSKIWRISAQSTESTRSISRIAARPAPAWRLPGCQRMC